MPKLNIAAPVAVNGIALVRSTANPDQVNLVLIDADGNYGNPAMTFSQEAGSNLVYGGRDNSPAPGWMLNPADGKIYLG